MSNTEKYNQIKQEFADADCVLISTEYINNRTPLEYICNKHQHRGVQTITYSNFKRGRCCAFCMYEKGRPPQHLPEVIYKEATEELGFVFKGVSYENQKAIISFICPKHEDKGIQKVIWSSIRQKKNCCGYCNGKLRSTEDFQDMVSDILPNIRIDGDYLGARNRIDCTCMIHNYSWSPLAYNLLSGFGCPLCGNETVGIKKRTSVERKMETLNSIHPDIEFLTVPDTTKEKARCKCKICKHEWLAIYTNLVNPCLYTGCPKCAGTNSEKSLCGILDDFGLVYEQQKRFTGCKDKKTLPFDIYLSDYNILIEFDGEHHYYPIPRKSGDDGLVEFQKVQLHDKIKTEYCKNNNIPLIRIPYWERDDMEYYLFDQLVKYKVIEEIKISA